MRNQRENTPLQLLTPRKHLLESCCLMPAWHGPAWAHSVSLTHGLHRVLSGFTWCVHKNKSSQVHAISSYWSHVAEQLLSIALVVCIERTAFHECDVAITWRDDRQWTAFGKGFAFPSGQAPLPTPVPVHPLHQQRTAVEEICM